MKIESLDWNFVISTEELLAIKKVLSQIGPELDEELGLSKKEHDVLYRAYWYMVDHMQELKGEIDEC